jgi:hypothetical protein
MTPSEKRRAARADKAVMELVLPVQPDPLPKFAQPKPGQGKMEIIPYDYCAIYGLASAGIGFDSYWRGALFVLCGDMVPDPRWMPEDDMEHTGHGDRKRKGRP